MGDTTADIMLLAGATVYEGVPTAGTLSDLMTTSKASYGGILQEIYQISDTEVTEKYGKTATYTIREDGTMTITYNVAPADYTNKGRINEYGYLTTNTNPYFVNDTTNEAYRAPANTETASDASALKKATLVNIFGVDATIAEGYVSAANGYKYTYDGTSLNVFKNSNLATTTDATLENAVKTTVDQLRNYAADFDWDANKFTEFLNSAAATSAGSLYYTFVNGALNVYTATNKTVPGEQSPTGSSILEDGTMDYAKTYLDNYSTTDYNALDADAVTAIANATDLTEAEIEALMTDPAASYYFKISDKAADGTITFYSATDPADPDTYTAITTGTIKADETINYAQILSDAGFNEGEVYKLTDEAVNALVKATGKSEAEIRNDDENKYFKIEQLTGSGAIIFYKEKTEPEINPTPAFTGSTYNETYTNQNPAFSETSDYKTVYGLNDGSAYVLESKDSYTLNDIPEGLLAAVYGLDKAEILTSTGKTATELSVSFSSGGALSISYVDTFDQPTKDGYEASVGEDGAMKYTTSADRIAYDDVPLTGNIADLLATASGPYKGLLRDVFGITDEDADAYGTDGTYKINADGTITLTTGSHTIQMEFDAANGALVSANDNSAGVGLVNMIFDQNTVGLEAFGYQRGDNDPEELIAGHMTFDFSTVTNYNTSGSSTIKAVKGDKKSLNTGRAVGEMNGVTVSTDGQIYATYSNGQTIFKGQIGVAEFSNAMGLEKVGDNLYAESLNSGRPQIQDVTANGGYITSGVLEGSNVELAKEFTDMITTQRGFQANSKVITTSDEMLQILKGLKR